MNLNKEQEIALARPFKDGLNKAKNIILMQEQKFSDKEISLSEIDEFIKVFHTQQKIEIINEIYDNTISVATQLNVEFTVNKEKIAFLLDMRLGVFVTSVDKDGKLV